MRKQFHWGAPCGVPMNANILLLLLFAFSISILRLQATSCHFFSSLHQNANLTSPRSLALLQAVTPLSWCDRAHCLLEDRTSWGSHEGVKARGSFNEPGIPLLIKWLMVLAARCLEFKGRGKAGMIVPL